MPAKRTRQTLLGHALAVEQQIPQQDRTAHDVIPMHAAERDDQEAASRAMDGVPIHDMRQLATLDPRQLQHIVAMLIERLVRIRFYPHHRQTGQRQGRMQGRTWTKMTLCTHMRILVHYMFH